MYTIICEGGHKLNYPYKTKYNKDNPNRCALLPVILRRRMLSVCALRFPMTTGCLELSGNSGELSL